MGAAAARALAKRGHDVTIYEQFEHGHERGSSHGATRIYRYSYPMEMYVGMMREALGLWRDLESESGETLLTQTGGLDCGKPLAEHAMAMEKHGIPFEILDPSDVRQRWSSLELPDTALFQADGGFVRADSAWAALVAGAEAAGASIERRRVEALADLSHDRVVVTAGGWARALLATAGIELPTRATRETVAFFRTDEVLPTLVDWGDPSVYALPDPAYGLKVGEHIAGPTTDPDEEGVVDEVSVERLRRWVGERYLNVDTQPAFTQTCIYTNTPDEHFVLERRDDIVVGSACSGHGFKFAPLIGKRLADLAES